MGGQVVLAEAEVRHAGRVSCSRSRFRETPAVATAAATTGASSMDVELPLFRCELFPKVLLIRIAQGVIGNRSEGGLLTARDFSLYLLSEAFLTIAM